MAFAFFHFAIALFSSIGHGAAPLTACSVGMVPPICV